jgi:hypothetical protein
LLVLPPLPAQQIWSLALLACAPLHSSRLCDFVNELDSVGFCYR